MDEKTLKPDGFLLVIAVVNSGNPGKNVRLLSGIKCLSQAPEMLLRGVRDCCRGKRSRLFLFALDLLHKAMPDMMYFALLMPCACIGFEDSGTCIYI